MLEIAIILGTTRPGRNGEAVANWILERASHRTAAHYTLIDLAEVDLPMLDEAVPAIAGRYSNPHTLAWAERIAPFDGFVFVTPEYNHTTSPALLNALDYLYAEWNNKAAAFVSYGTSSGVRATEHLRQVASELQIATVRSQVAFSVYTDFTDRVNFTPGERYDQQTTPMFDQLEQWATAMATIRS